MRSKIAVIGEKGSVMGFRAVGFQVFEAEEAPEIEAALQATVKQEYGVVFLTEQALAKVPHALDAYKNLRIPAIIPIPGREGSLGIGMASLHKSVERAVGADILSND